MPSSKKTFHLEEYPDATFIKIIHSHPDIYQEQRQVLKNYTKCFNGETVNVEYIKHSKYGRYFIKDTSKLSSTVMWNKIRSTLFAKTDYDIDIVNCHSNILLTLLNPDYYDVDKLKYYCENRNEVIDSIYIDPDAIASYNEINQDNKNKKDIVKSLFTIILYGGSVDKWANTFNLDTEDYRLTDFVKDYIEEIKTNMNIIICDKKFKDIVSVVREEKREKVKKKLGKKFDIEKFNVSPGKILSVILQEYECLIIDEAMKFMTKERCVITSYNYDGFQIKKIDDLDTVLKALNSHIQSLCISHNKTHFFTFENVSFIQKDFREGLDTSKLLILDSKEYSRDCMTKTDCYEIQKEYFEKFHFKCLTPICFVRIDTEEDVFIKADKIKSCYIEIKSKIIIDGKEELVPFINLWLNDDTMKIYTKCNYYPINEMCPKNCYNLWSPFPILNIKLDDTADTSVIYEHFNILFNRQQELVNYMLNWFAHLLQKPNRKTEVCIILFGEERTGKSTIGEYILRKIIGVNKIFITSKTDKVFGRFANTRGKLLCVLNEASGAETFSIADVLKDAITCVNTEQEKKGIDSVQVVDNTNFIFTTNNINSVKVNKGSSRYLPIEVSSEVKANKAYFNKLYSVLDDDLIMRKFYQELMDRDISDFHPSNDRPETDLMRDMWDMNADPVSQFIDYWKIETTRMKDIDDEDCYYIKKTMTATELYEAFRFWWKLEGKNDDTKPTRTKFCIRVKQFKNDVFCKRESSGVKYTLIAN